MYKHYGGYIKDKMIAEQLIAEHKEIPQDLYSRLVQAKKELKEQGIPIGYI